MKKTIIKIFLLAELAIQLTGCSKKSYHNVAYLEYGEPAGKAFLKINYECAYLANPPVQLKVNGQRVSNNLGIRTPYPGGGFNTNVAPNLPLYLSVPAGKDTLTLSIPQKNTDIDSILLYTTEISLPESAYYTIHFTDTLVNNTLNKTTSVLEKNDMSPVASGFTRFRYINLTPNVSAANGAIDLYLNEVMIASNIPYLGTTDTFSIATGLNAPGVPPGSTTAPTPVLKIRAAGAAPGSKQLDSLANINILQSARALTIFSLGYIGQAKGNRGPYITLVLDK